MRTAESLVQCIPYHEEPTSILQEKMELIDEMYRKIEVGSMTRVDASRTKDLLRELYRCILVEVVERRAEEKRRKR